MELIEIKDKIEYYLDKDHFENIHSGAFYGVLEVLFNFVSEGVEAVKDRQKALAWVCDAVMGSGKTTAIEVLLKYLADHKSSVPLLLVFNEKSLMKRIYDSLHKYGAGKRKYNLIEYVQTENINEVVHTLTKFQFVCITQQRFRDLTLGYGNWNDFRIFHEGTEPFHKDIERLVIVDEMPILFDESVFDISSKDNSVDWFDKMAEASKLTPSEIQFGRTMIMMLMTYEMLDSEESRTYTKPLIEGIKDSKMQERFEQILDKINIDESDFESTRKYKWFKKLLNWDGVGAIDRHSKGVSIICSRLIQYHKRGNILILDGTAKWNKVIYEKTYVIKEVTNFYNYSQRIKIHIKDINTSKESRENKDYDIHGKIASDFRELKEKLDTKVFPLSSKSDVKNYINNGVISPEQQEFYESQNIGEDTLPINLLNTRGKEELSDYNAIALMNIPIRNPQFYKIMAVGLFGVECNLEQNNKRQEQDNTGWFKDVQIQELFEKNLLADMLQIIHRTNLRKIKATSLNHVVLYTHLIGWGAKLQEALDIPKESLRYDIVGDKYNFISKCEEFAKKTRSFLEKQGDYFNNNSYTAGQIIKGDSFKNFIKKNWDDGYKSEKLNEIFNSYGIDISLDKKQNGKAWRSFSLTEDTHRQVYSVI
ncbi:DEAD/DEAH box helicase [Cytobacillus sp. SAFR-174]|uniref:DEAD/DEAH box helicase n=1 Tax=Cytobacillus sp. SAFR-174 TaxID=3436868 RepID=UPI003F80EAC9